MKILDAILSVCTNFTLMRTSIIADKNSKLASDKLKGKEIYESICRIIDISNITIPNRPEDMKLAFTENKSFIGPPAAFLLTRAV